MKKDVTRKVVKIFTTLFFILVIIMLSAMTIKKYVIKKPDTYILTETTLTHVETTSAVTTTIEHTTTQPSISKKVSKTTMNLTEEEIRLIALVTMAEAEGEPELGKRLVIDTILNRVDSKHFPNTVKGVVYQSNQFSSVWNGRIDRCYVRDDIYQLVVEEAESRANQHVIFFRTDYYHPYGTPMFSIGDHYFSEY